MAACRPVSGKFVRRCASASKWLRHDSSSWQEAQREPNSPVCRSTGHAAQLVGTALLKSSEPSHDVQVVKVSRPPSGNPVWSWSKVMRIQHSTDEEEADTEA